MAHQQLTTAQPPARHHHKRRDDVEKKARKSSTIDAKTHQRRSFDNCTRTPLVPLGANFLSASLIYQTLLCSALFSQAWCTSKLWDSFEKAIARTHSLTKKSRSATRLENQTSIISAENLCHRIRKIYQSKVMKSRTKQNNAACH